MKSPKIFQPLHSFYSISWIAVIFILTYACDKTNLMPDDKNPVDSIEGEAIQKTSQDLYQATSEEYKNNNFAISPLSIQLALYMVYNGAEGETQTEIGKLLRVANLDMDTLNAKVQSLMKYFNNLISKGNLDIHNALFYDESRVELAENYVDKLKKYFDAYQSDLNFGDPSAVASINEWVQDKTYDKIKEVIQTISDQEVLFLINALYLKADWVNGFLVETTADRPFFTMEGKEISIPTMHRTMGVEQLTKDGYQIARLPLADSALFVYLVMPQQSSQLSSAIQSDVVGGIWNNSLEFQNTRVMFEMPVIETKTHVMLNGALQSLGMVSAFDPQQAELGNIGQAQNGLPLHISRTLHDVYLKMDEKGVEGAAVTTIGVGTTSLPPSLQFNKPFLYLIVDQELGLPLFIGQFTGVDAKN